MKNKIILDLKIFGYDLPHDEITKSIGTAPSRTLTIGELQQLQSIITNKENCWILSSGMTDSNDFENHLNNLLEIIQDNFDGFKSICNKYYTEISCKVWISLDNGESTPSIHINSSQLKILNEINANIDYDIYLIPRE